MPNTKGRLRRAEAMSAGTGARIVFVASNKLAEGVAREEFGTG
jgi:hypothetical protein